MRAAWLVRIRQMEGRFAFWLALIGYNKRDKSLSHRIYLVYAFIFMSAWTFAVFTLFAGAGAGLLKAINPANPPSTAAWLAFLALSVWGIFSFIRFSRRSPFIFTEDDAFLICQTPIDRRAVALAWFPGDWLESALPFWALVITLGFSLAELGLHGQATVVDIPSYVWMGLRALLLFLPVHMGVLALLWAAGALRLRGAADFPWLRWIAFGLAIVFFGWLVLNLAEHGFSGNSQPVWQLPYWPLYFPLMGSFGQADLAQGLVLGLAWAAGGLVALWASSKNLNLSRAAQEARGLAAQQQAMRSGAFDKAQAIAQQERLGMGHSPSQIIARPGLAALAWKDIVQSLRTFRLTAIFPWVYVLIASVGIATLPGWAPRALAGVIWCIAAGQAVTQRLRNDLARWSLLRQLPFTVTGLLAADLVTPFALCLLVTWLGLLPGVTFLGTPGFILLVLVPSATASVIIFAAHDILRQSHVSSLIAGTAGELSARGALFAFLSIGLPCGLVFWLAGQGLLLEISAVFGLLTSLLMAFIAWELAISALKEIE